ncbi:nucleosidase [Flavobacterium agricola]|uniref:Nucleosidase n=2 Tax=Flavobacterium agricola TaxID=2870839 RepID=A0ABY6M2C0_9FLAO|nr:nucleosidase [Flavobacterium agricola]
MIINAVKYEKNEILFVFALESEAGTFFNDYNLVFTGIGKINATLKVIQAIQKYQPKLIINLGTAGSTTFVKYAIVNCTQFIQRDMDVTGLGFELYQTPLTNQPVILDYGIKLPNLEQGICGTGDNFETNLINKPFTVVDMEAYALALVAKQYEIDFLCLKFISDGADEDAASSWTTNVSNAPEAFSKILF